MFPRTCCVAECNCTNIECRLFIFPRNDRLREIWRGLVLPHNQKLSTGRGNYICIHHFEPKHLRGGKKRTMLSYPTLFTPEEMATKKPNTTIKIDLWDGTIPEHGYCLPMPSDNDHQHSLKRTTSAESDESCAAIPDMDSGGDWLHAASNGNTKRKRTDSPQADNRICPNDTGSSNSNINNHSYYYIITTTETPVAVESTNTATCKTIPMRRNRIVQSIQNLSPKCKKMYETCSKIIRSQKRAVYTCYEKIKKIRELCQNNSFETFIDTMTPAAKTFLNMHMRQCNKHIKKRRFNNEEKLFALSLYKHRPKAYKFLQKMFLLPSKSALNKFSNNIPITSGLNPQVLVAIKNVSANWAGDKKLCSIVFDEVALTPHLTYVETQDQIQGFVNFGNERQLKLCDRALVVMIRGVCTSWSQPIAYYLSEGSTPATTMKIILREIVEAVCQIGLKPMALICDQGSAFQSCMRSFKRDDERDPLLVDDDVDIDNKINIGGHKLHIMYDPLHLIRGIRNNLLKYKMMFQGKIVKWRDIADVYKADCELGEIRMLQELTDEHVIPYNINKNNLQNCTQVFSKKTSALLQYTARYKKHANGMVVSPTMKSTAEAVLFFHRLFDSVNGSEMRGPVEGVNGISKHVAFWRKAISMLKQAYFLDSNGRKLQVPSVSNWITTLKSFIGIWSDLKVSRIISFYTHHLNRDPLENFFNRVRALNYRNIKPDSFIFQTAYKSLLVCNLLSDSQNFSCQDDMTETLFEPIDSSINLYVLSLQMPQYTSVYSSELTDPASPLQQAGYEILCSQASAYTASCVSRILLKKIKCKTCKAIFLTSDVTKIHSWITLKERSARNLCYPTNRFIILFRQLIFVINNYLNVDAHNPSVVYNIKFNFLCNVDVDWFGCSQHHNEALDYFVTLVCRLQIQNWCDTINNILNGTVGRLSTTKLSPLERLALKKFKSMRGKK